MRCDDCPAPADRPCLGQSHPRLCELQRDRDDYRRLLTDRAGPTPPAPPPPEPTPPAGPSPRVAEALRLAKEVRECPHLTKGCGCPGATDGCALGRFGGKPTHLDCRACRRDDAIEVLAHLNGFTGYGQHTLAIARELETLGVPLVFDPIDLVERGFIPLDDFVRRRRVGRDDKAPTGRRVLMSSNPETVARDPGRTVNLTMWETTRISPQMARNCNALRGIIVPSEVVAGWFRDSGVVVPIRIAPLGIDPAAYHPAGRFAAPRPPGPTRFGCAGRTKHGGVRKGLDDVIAAFLAAFPPGDGRAALDVKCWPDCDVRDPGDPRVRILREPLSSVGLADWYRSLDAFVSASRGEGWGMQPHQAMACGTAVVAALWGGHRAFMTDDSCYPVEHDEMPAEGPIYGGLGNWCVARQDSLVGQMRRVVARPDEARAKGAAAAGRAAEFPWSRTARAVLDAYRELQARPEPDPAAPPPLIVPCGAGIYLGNNAACSLGGWASTIHIVRGPDDARSCRPGRDGTELAITWVEKEPIRPHARRIVDFARSRPGTLLVHCEGGIFRSPHAALLAGIGRGIDPRSLIGLVTAERWRLGGHAPQWQFEYLDEIWRTWQESQAAPALAGGSVA